MRSPLVFEGRWIEVPDDTTDSDIQTVAWWDGDRWHNFVQVTS